MINLDRNMRNLYKKLISKKKLSQVQFYFCLMFRDDLKFIRGRKIAKKIEMQVIKEAEKKKKDDLKLMALRNQKNKLELLNGFNESVEKPLKHLKAFKQSKLVNTKSIVGTSCVDDINN